jgi:hypothetical protein
MGAYTRRKMYDDEGLQLNIKRSNRKHKTRNDIKANETE